MSSEKLKKDLKNCLVTFDRRIVLTELVDDYNLSYEEVNTVLLEHLKQEENKGEIKYDKCYLVHGVENLEKNKKEIYKIVEKQKLKEWLEKLQNAEYSLYSVEVAGGAKAAAPVFKPLKLKEGVTTKERTRVNAADSSSTLGEISKHTSTAEKKEIKKEALNPFQESAADKTNKDTGKTPNKPVTPVKKTSPKIESSPTAKKASDKKSAVTTHKKGGINNFFAPAANKKMDSDVKDKKKSLKPPTPKKMNDFFKKQTEKPKATEIVKTTANTSIQLFDPEDEEKVESEEVSSDEEEKIEALKRDIISSDVEMDANEETDNQSSTTAKRRRILDSDDEEEDPPIKHEKLEVEVDNKKVAEPETYLDEEGFVITKKPKQKASVAKPSAIRTTPAVTLKASTKDNKKVSPGTSKSNKAVDNAAPKTKQANIKSFFSKK